MAKQNIYDAFEKLYKEDKKDSLSASEEAKQAFEEMILRALKSDLPLDHNAEIIQQVKDWDFTKDLPEHLFGAAAEVLAFIYSMEEKRERNLKNEED